MLTGAISGLSLGSSIWNATHKPKEATAAQSQFDQMMNTVSSETFISIIYGQRKWAGAQLYHKASADGLGLTKDILIGEGTIGGVYGVCANDILVSTGSVFTLKNIDYADATVTITTGNLRLYANSVATDIPLVTTKDDIVTFDYNVTIDKLIGHLGTIGNGWVIGNAVNCANGTTEIHALSTTNCYNSATSMTVTGLTGCTYEFHDGSPTQAAPSNYGTVGGYKNMAWLRVNLVYSAKLSSGGNPTISYVVNGIKVLDTRTSVTATSSNPAMITRNLLLSKRYGAARFIPDIAELLDEDSFKEVADYCDESVNYIDSNGITHSEPRYTTNIIIDTKKNLSEVLDDILASYGGFLVLANGKIGLRIEAPTTSVYDFTSDTIVAESFSMEQLSIDETPNKYLVGYFDMTQNWTQVKCIVEDAIDQQPKPIGRGKVISKELTLTGCTSQSQAIRQGRLQKLKNKLCSLTATWKTSTFAMHLQPGDVVTTTYDKVDDNGEILRIIDKMPWRILEISQQDGVYTLKGRQYNASIYGDVTEVIEIKDYTPIDNPLSDVVPVVTNLVISEDSYVSNDGTVFTNVNIEYTPVKYAFTREYDVYYDVGLSGSWTYYGKTQDSVAVLRSLSDVIGKSVRVGVVTENKVGRKSVMAVSNAITLVGKSDPPSDIANFAVGESNGTLHFTWISPSIPDLKCVEIREGIAWDNSTMIQRISTGNTYQTTMYANGNKTYLIKAIDNSGNYSNNASMYSITTIGSPYKNIVQNIEIVVNQSLPVIRMNDAWRMNDGTFMNSLTDTHKTIYLDAIDLGSVMTATIAISSYYSNNDNTKTSIEISTSTDGMQYSAWTDYVISMFICRYFKLRISIESTNGHSNTVAQSLSIDVLQYESLATITELNAVTQQYKHTQSIASTVWSITHNMGKYPQVQIIDNDKDVCVGDVRYDNINQLTIYFSHTVSGMAYCS